MSDPKDTSSFFRKVVKFVANPTTEWAEIDGPVSEPSEDGVDKSELKAMVERKRRNDFVRKREFNMLRKVRRDGLTTEQLAALGGSSRLDDSDVRVLETGAKPELGVKAKIDEIEQQMVGETYTRPRRAPEFFSAETQPGQGPDAPPVDLLAGSPRGRQASPRSGAAAPNRPNLGFSLDLASPRGAAPSAGRQSGAPAPGPAPAPATEQAAAAPATAAHAAEPAQAASDPFGLAASFNVDVGNVTHDPGLDEAVISFANADFEGCEKSLIQLVASGGERAQHAETWLVLFDLYRAVGNQARFESLALDYARQFGWSAPQWFSMPKMVAEAVVEEEAPKERSDGQVGWVSPPYIDADAIAGLSARALQLPLPWVFDWGPLRAVEGDGYLRLLDLFRSWSPQPLDMRWLGGDHLLRVLQEASPNGARDVDPVVWRLRLEALRLANRADQFDETAINYCMTYEVSPPSWDPSRCTVRMAGSTASSHAELMGVVGEVSTSFVESQIMDEEPQVLQVTSVELSGQLIGDIGPTLKRLDEKLGGAQVVNVMCSNHIRVDVIAAGDLLNWVLSRRSESRAISFLEAQRLVALFFGAMGINEHAKVKVRTN